MYYQQFPQRTYLTAIKLQQGWVTMPDEHIIQSRCKLTNTGCGPITVQRQQVSIPDR